MKKIIIILIFAISLIGCQSKCDSDNLGFCELETIKDFEIEDDSEITIGVYNQQFGKQFVELFEEKYPDLKDRIFIEEIGIEDNIKDSFENYDLIQMHSENTPLYLDHLASFDESFSELVSNEKISKFSKLLNQEAIYFIPFDIEGLLFAYNKTMLESFNVDLVDENNDSIPDAIDSFEKINELANSWRQEKVLYLDKELEDIFAFPLNDQLSMLSFLFNEDYRLIDGLSGEELNVENLNQALENLNELGKYKWRYDKSKANDTVWNYEYVIENQSAPFLLVGSFMYHQYFQQNKAYTLGFSKLPQFKEKDLFTFSSVSGFVLNKDSQYPNLANFVVKFLKSSEASKLAFKNNIVPLVNDDIFLEENIDVDDLNRLKAFYFSESIPLQAFRQNSSVKAFDVFLEIDFRDVMSDVFLNKIDVDTAKDEIIRRLSDWLDNYNIEIEGINEKELEENN